MRTGPLQLVVYLAQQSAATPPTDYTPAVLALAGALAGSLITGVIALIGTAISVKNQRKLLSLQLEHAVMEGNRAERRKIYGEFIDCMERWNLLVLDVSTHVETVPKKYRDDPKKAPGGQVLTEIQDTLWDRWRETWGRLHLVASAKVEAMAGSIFSQYQQDMGRAWEGRVPDHGHSTGKVFPITLMAEMQRDVGVRGGIAVDPDTGLRAQSPPEERPTA